jgi:hypothetical protein
VVKFFLEELELDTGGLEMREIRHHAQQQISSRIDRLIKKHPPKPKRGVTSEELAAKTGMQLKETARLRELFDFFDTDKDGYIHPKDLTRQLARIDDQEREGASSSFSHGLTSMMIRTCATDYDITDRGEKQLRGVSFQDFVNISKAGAGAGNNSASRPSAQSVLGTTKSWPRSSRAEAKQVDNPFSHFSRRQNKGKKRRAPHPKRQFLVPGETRVVQEAKHDSILAEIEEQLDYEFLLADEEAGQKLAQHNKYHDRWGNIVPAASNPSGAGGRV